MPHLDHTIVPAHDKEATARWFAEIMGLEYKGPWGHFAPVKVDEYLSMDFDTSDDFQPSHYAFIVTDPEGPVKSSSGAPQPESDDSLT